MHSRAGTIHLINQSKSDLTHEILKSINYSDIAVQNHTVVINNPLIGYKGT